MRISQSAAVDRASQCQTQPAVGGSLAVQLGRGVKKAVLGVTLALAAAQMSGCATIGEGIGYGIGKALRDDPGTRVIAERVIMESAKDHLPTHHGLLLYGPFGTPNKYW